MARFTVQHAYQAFRDGSRIGPWQAGESVDVDEELAGWVNRDSPGALTPASDETPAPKRSRAKGKA